MKLIVGLGNPGIQYVNTRHNIGFKVLDHIANSLGVNFKVNSGCALVKCVINNNQCILLKPLDYMNNSGFSVQKILNFYKIKTSDLIVVYDDLDLPFAKTRLKFSGGSGGHNGIKSIIGNNNSDFWRLKIGIGRPETKQQVSSYVLSNFYDEQNQLLPEILDEVTTKIHDNNLFFKEKNSQQND